MIHQDNIRMTGFLEKKGKMKLMSPWKKYWFVLEKRLLLYYRSEIEYSNLSPCRGSLNMGLVTTVRPGTSSGPCVIHIVTRTQAIQLRAKTRAAQEEWLQALLHSMSLPVVPKCLKPPLLKPKFFGHTASLDNVAFNDKCKRSALEEEWSLPRRLTYRKRQISGSYYGGSLDTAIWTKKFKPVRTPSSGLNRDKIVEKSLDSSNESNSSCLANFSQKELNEGVYNDAKSRILTNASSVSDEIIRKRSCRLHDDDGENKKQDLSGLNFPYETTERPKKIEMTDALTANRDNGVKQTETESFPKVDKRNESPFEKFKSTLSRVPREKISKNKPEVARRGSTKKRRQSFLQKVFGRKGHESQEETCESDGSDSLYDVISPAAQRLNGTHLREQRQSGNHGDRNRNSENEKGNRNCSRKEETELYAGIRKNANIFRAISSNSPASEVKARIDSRESLLEESAILSENDDQLGRKESNGKEKTSVAPLLPPRRVSRPVSPWHDVPTNNSPIDSGKKIFFSHQAIVKFKDPVLPCTVGFSGCLNDLIVREDDKNDDLEIEQDKDKTDDLSLLLEQLTKITVAPMGNSHIQNSSWDVTSNKIKEKSPFSDPDYDVPRPHRAFSGLASEQNGIISTTNFSTVTCHDNSDKSLLCYTMEPDSLESIGGKQIEA